MLPAFDAHSHSLREKLAEAGNRIAKGLSMMKRKRTEITFETRSLVLRRTRQQASLYSTTCSTPTLLLAPDEAAVLAGVNTRTIYRWVETEQLHFTETQKGELFVCPKHITD